MLSGTRKSDATTTSCLTTVSVHTTFQSLGTTRAPERYLRDPRVHSVRLPTLDSPDFGVADQLFARTQTRDKAFYYRIDEPGPERFSEVKRTTRQLHARDPQLRHLVTVHPNAALNGAVDIWCPDIGDIFGLGHLDLAELARQRRLGRQTWFYTMVEPKSPYPTWLLDDDAASVRVYGALMARWGIEGFVYSMAHGWGPRPLRDLTSFAGTNGDGTLLYPAELVGGSGPMPSIRLMLLRDALEDAELLKMAHKSSFDDAIVRGWTASLLPTSPRHPLLVGAGTFPTASLENWKSVRSSIFDRLAKRGHTLGKPLTLAKTEAERSINVFEVPHATAVIDGHLNEALWSFSTHTRDVSPHDFSRFSDDTWRPPATQMWAVRDGNYLCVGVRCMEPQGSEWVALELAPRDAHERWRFIITRCGTLSAEHHTCEGQFKANTIKWQGARLDAAHFWNAEFRIPLSLVGRAQEFRFNAIRRTQTIYGTRVLLRAVPDEGDVTLMPIVK